MKQILFAASACIGLFAFTTVGGSLNHHPMAKGSVVLTDTTHKPKPDSARVLAFQEAQMDTTKKPKPDSVRSVVFNSVMADTTKKPKPDSLMIAMR
jgi:hypothetical protein